MIETLKDKFFERCALGWARKMGYEGDTLPTGEPHGDVCPMAQATGRRMTGMKHFKLGTFEEPELTPLGVRFFIARFDAGRYPHLLPENGDIGTEIQEGEIIPISVPDPTYVPQEPAVPTPVREPEKV